VKGTHRTGGYTGEGVTGTVIVTGTDTGVGKTIVTAAIAAAATAAGVRVAVVKPAQTGVPDAYPLDTPGEEPDTATVARLGGPVDVRTLASYPDPLAPLTAAAVSGRPPLQLGAAVEAVRAAEATHDLVLVEGAGGLLVPMGSNDFDDRGWTVADLAVELACPAVVVVRAGLGTLNHTALTREACDRRSIATTIVIGAWPAEPELVHRTNLGDLPAELAGVLPEGAGRLTPARFRGSAPAWVSPWLHGSFDPDAFRSAAAFPGRRSAARPA
jgi:dethiobiotin synthetase